MTSPAELEAKFWKALSGDRTAMLGLAGVDGHSQPMTAQILHEETARGPIWFFSSSETDLVKSITGTRRAMLHFSAKGHDLFASVQGDITLDDNRPIIDRLWNPFVAAWYEGGKEDPKLRLLRLDPDHAQVWLNENSLLAGVKMLLGRDPKQEYGDKVADIKMRRG